jgi:regulator of RNase E activity RraA
MRDFNRETTVGTASLHEAAGKTGALPAAIRSSRPIQPSMRVIGPALPVRVPSRDNLRLHRAIYAAGRGDVLGESVTVGGIRVSPGDWLLGDGDGVVVIPASRTGVVLEAAVEISEAEAHIRRAVEDGAALRDARAEFGYHRLQSRRV